MRIRKRWSPPLSVSPLVAPPDVISSTPQPSGTQPDLHHNFTGQDLRQPEPQLVKVSTINGWHCPNSYDSEAKKTVSLEPPPTAEESASDDKRFSAANPSVEWWYNPGNAETSGASSVSSSFSSSTVMGRWCGEEKAIPLKKRRSIFITTLLNNIETTREKEKEERAKKSGAITNNELVEESLRCRRANGKKWRCLRRSLEGFSNCKYHVDQTRLRRSGSICKPKKVEMIGSYFDGEDDNHDGCEVRKKKEEGMFGEGSVNTQYTVPGSSIKAGRLLFSDFYVIIDIGQ